MEKTIIIYHADCIDGTTAAAIALKKFPDALFFPLSHSYTQDEMAPIRVVARGAAIFILDCALGVDELLADGHSVVVLDHHETVRDEMQKRTEADSRITYVFDNEKSGASLAWSYFFPEEPIPQIVHYVEDVDLWQWKFGDAARHTMSYLSMFRNDPTRMLEAITTDAEVIVEKGRTLSEYADREIEEQVSILPNEMRVDTHFVPAYNITVYTSAAGNILSEQQGSVVALYTIKGSNVRISFRSKEGQNPTARMIAEKLGGGGHDHASGANVPLADFLKMIA
jgi:oligoribonuclease NrnB/cAMP/cGMP phosphodiesterase (DHH superfamily)